jgi:hypothetical protein
VRLRVTDDAGAVNDTSRSLGVNAPPLPPAPAGPLGPPPATGQSSTNGKCATVRAKRARLNRRLQSARRKLARAHTTSKKRYYRRVIRNLAAQRKRLKLTGC